MKQIHNELQLRFREYAESYLAQMILKNPELVAPAVNKITASILKIISTYETEVKHILATSEDISKYLYGVVFFGHLDKKTNPFNDIISILTSSDNPLIHIMQIHNIFIQKIYDLLPIASEKTNKSQKQMLVATLFPGSLFNDRGRIDHGECKLKETNVNGITKTNIFSKNLMSTQKHYSSTRRFDPDERSEFYKKTKEKNLPFVAGISGNTGSFLLGALLYGSLEKNSQELKQYVLAIFAFLCTGGHHSWHEVMSVGQLAGLDYEPDGYLKPALDHLREAHDHNDILNEFNTYNLI